MQSSSPTLVNSTKQRMLEGNVALGLSVRLVRSAEIVRIARASGHDFVFIDTQHSIFDLETIGHIAQTAMACGIEALVRVRSVDDPDTSLLLDNGVAGIVFPDVNSADEAHRCVATTKFPPVGKRSAAGGYPHFDFRPLPLATSLPKLNDATLVVCMIETLSGLQNVEAIAAVEGVDVLHLGSNDLLVNMGKAGQFDDPEFHAALERIYAAAKANGKLAGIGGNRDVARQADAIRKGARFVTTQTDVALLSAAASQWTDGLRNALVI